MREANHSQVPSRAGVFAHSPWKRRGILFLTNLTLFSTLFFLAEIGFRLFDNPKYVISTERWRIGSGQTDAGRKYWPQTTYWIDSSEFHQPFRTNGKGDRARPEPVHSQRPYRIALVGDSFTEAMQVAYDKTFCALLERGLAASSPGPEIVCDNYGIAATDLFEYWHRITHDILRPQPPHALILCLYPGNDFMGMLPDDGFDASGQPRPDYFRQPSWAKHVLTWVNLKSRFGSYLQRLTLKTGLGIAGPRYKGPALWWTDPALARRFASEPEVQRSRAILRAIEAECRRAGTQLCILVIGPVDSYVAKDGGSPLERIISDWQIEVPVVDVAIKVRSVPGFERLLFPRDGHPNETGHALIADEALAPVRCVLFGSPGFATLLAEPHENSRVPIRSDDTGRVIGTSVSGRHGDERIR